MSRVIPSGCPIEHPKCVAFKKFEDVVTLDIDFEAATVPLGTPRPGSLKSWDMPNAVTLPGGAGTIDLMVDLISSGDPANFDIVLGPPQPQQFISVGVPAGAGTNTNVVRFSYDPVAANGLTRWRLFLEDIDGPAGEKERVCFDKSVVNCWSVLSPSQGGRLTVTESPTQVCVEGQDDNANFDIPHTLAILSSTVTSQLDLIFEVESDGTGTSTIREFYPTAYVPGTQLGGANYCPGNYEILTQVYDCQTQLTTYFDEFGVEIPPSAFTIVDPSFCGL